MGPTERVAHAIVASNGEKRLLWRFLEILIAVCGIGALMLGALNMWAIRDYLEFKQISAQRWHADALSDQRRDDRHRWEQRVLLKIADKLQIEVDQPPPDPPPDYSDPRLLKP